MTFSDFLNKINLNHNNKFNITEDPKILSAISNSINYLASEEALMSIEQDPYWPKWNSPWWHMVLLWEMGHVSKIPPQAIHKIVQVLNTHYLKFFPLQENELPDGVDPYRHIACHCALGTIYQVLYTYGIHPDEELPWIRSWFLKYQLPDGGLNCDESAYSKETLKSSMLSALPPLEAILLCTPRYYTNEENIFLNKGAAYIISHKLFRSISKNGKIINEDWLKLCFPRFYNYDILRGLSFLAKWAKLCNKSIPYEVISESINIIYDNFPNMVLSTQRLPHENTKTLLIDSDNNWTHGHSSTMFNLLLKISDISTHSPYLTKIWYDTLKDLHELHHSGLLK